VVEHIGDQGEERVLGLIAHWNRVCVLARVRSGWRESSVSRVRKEEGDYIDDSRGLDWRKINNKQTRTDTVFKETDVALA
jgi:hypothetical protein